MRLAITNFNMSFSSHGLGLCREKLEKKKIKKSNLNKMFNKTLSYTAKKIPFWKVENWSLGGRHKL